MSYYNLLAISIEEMWPEALPAFAIIAGCVTFTGLALRFLDKYEHNGKVSYKIEFLNIIVVLYHGCCLDKNNQISLLHTLTIP